MKYAALAGSALASILLTGCNDQEEVAVPPVDEVGVIVADDAYPVGGTLTEQQQQNYDTFDRDLALREFESGMTDMSGDAMASGTTMDPAMPNGQGGNQASDMQPGQASGGMSGTANALRPRSQMDFGFLDRNGDNQLSVGEYAIWAVRANPASAAPNDGTRPFISTEQLNEAGQTFFYFDRDGNTYLSDEEFTTARNSAMTP